MPHVIPGADRVVVPGSPKSAPGMIVLVGRVASPRDFCALSRLGPCHPESCGLLSLRLGRPSMTECIPNVLANRYASAAMRHLWSPENKVLLERQLWLSVLRAQKQLGLDVTDQALAEYE